MATLIIPANYEETARIKPFLVAQLADLPEALQNNLILAVHELFILIIDQSYRGAVGEVLLEVHRMTNQFQVILRDEGIPIPPTAAANTFAEDIPPHQWGELIIQSVMDEIVYRRTPQGNEWILSKNW